MSSLALKQVQMLLLLLLPLPLPLLFLLLLLPRLLRCAAAVCLALAVVMKCAHAMDSTPWCHQLCLQGISKSAIAYIVHVEQQVGATRNVSVPPNVVVAWRI